MMNQRLVRVSDGVVAGVAGGLARRLGWNPTTVRLLWLASIALGGVGILLYLVLWELMPNEDFLPEEPPHDPRVLTRTIVDRKLWGVFGGVAQYYGKDPVLVRLLGVGLMFLSFGFFSLAYLAAVLFLPALSRTPFSERSRTT